MKMIKWWKTKESDQAEENMIGTQPSEIDLHPKTWIGPVETKRGKVKRETK